MCGAGLHCTAPHRLPHEQEAARLGRPPGSRPPLEYPRQESHCGYEYEARPTALDAPLPSQRTLMLCFLGFYYFYFRHSGDEKEFEARHTQPPSQGGIPSLLVKKERAGNA